MFQLTLMLILKIGNDKWKFRNLKPRYYKLKMEKKMTTPNEFYNLRFTDELTFPSIVKLGTKRQYIYIDEVNISLHSNLPNTPIWAYTVDVDGKQLINPSFEVESGIETKIAWVNNLNGKTLPIEAATVEYACDKKCVNDNSIPQNEPGTVKLHDSQTVTKGVRKGNDTFLPITDIPPITVAHLHGGNTEANSDGWTENVIAPGQQQLDQYSNKQPSTLLWYHDHAMHITRLNVYSGLAGLYFIRDDNDRRILNELQLLGDCKNGRPEFELPLLIQDCNLDVDANGKFTGKLLHKVESGGEPMEFFGPYTMVNKQIWPKCTVKRRQYRLRLLNGSNARTYRLSLLVALEDGSLTPVEWSWSNNGSKFATQIGSDGGLLAKPFDISKDLVLAPAERLDLIVDFSANFGISNVKSIVIVNTAGAPFNGKENSLSAVLEETSVDNPKPNIQDLFNGRVRYPAVMRFDLEGKSETLIQIPETLSSNFCRIVHDEDPSVGNERILKIPETDDPGHHKHRYVALVEEQLSVTSKTKVLTLRELEPYKLGSQVMDRLIEIIEPDPKNQANLVSKLYQTAAKLFHDGVNISCNLGAIEVWKVINLSPDTHPLHIHLTQMQVIGRLQASDPKKMIPDPDTLNWLDLSSPVTITLDDDPYKTSGIPESDKAWKDVVRIDPGEIVKIAVPLGTIDTSTNPATIKAEGFCGRYMYHCHILEHEDHDMMRPFLVLDKSIADLMHHQH